MDSLKIFRGETAIFSTEIPEGLTSMQVARACIDALSNCKPPRKTRSDAGTTKPKTTSHAESAAGVE